MYVLGSLYLTTATERNSFYAPASVFSASSTAASLCYLSKMPRNNDRTKTSIKTLYLLSLCACVHVYLVFFFFLHLLPRSLKEGGEWTCVLAPDWSLFFSGDGRARMRYRSPRERERVRQCTQLEYTTTGYIYVRIYHHYPCMHELNSFFLY